MSYFLEDTNRASSVGVIVDYTGMNEAMLNAEIAWSNITESAMINEYQAIKNESQIMLQEGISDFFEKVKVWFKKMIQSISRVVSNIKNKIMLKTNYYKKYALSAAKAMPKLKAKLAKMSDNKKIKVVLTKDIQGVLQHVDKIKNLATTYSNTNTLDKSDYKDKISELNNIYSEFSQAVTKATENPKEITVKLHSGSAGVYIDYLKNCGKTIQDTIKAYDTASKTCKEGIKWADKENKDKVSELKTTATFINQCSSRYLNASMRIASIYKSNLSKFVNAVKSSSSGKDKDKEFDKAIEKMNKDNTKVDIANATVQTSSYYGF